MEKYKKVLRLVEERNWKEMEEWLHEDFMYIKETALMDREQHVKRMENEFRKLRNEVLSRPKALQEASWTPEAPIGTLWGLSLGALGSYLGVPGSLLCEVWSALGVPGALGRCWVAFVCSWAAHRRSWGALGLSWASLGAHVGSARGL